MIRIVLISLFIAIAGSSYYLSSRGIWSQSTDLRQPPPGQFSARQGSPHGGYGLRGPVK